MPNSISEDASTEIAVRKPDASDNGMISVVAALADPAIIITQDNSVMTANVAALRIFPALRAGESLLFGLRDPDVFAALELLRRDYQIKDIEFNRRIPDDFTYHLRLAPLAQGDVLMVFQDLSERRRIERMRVDFVANASHELRTPLAALMGFIETLEGPARDDAAARARFLGVMREQTKRMSRLVDDLLSLSRLEARTAAAQMHPVDLVGLIREVIDVLNMLAVENEVKISFRTELDRAIVSGVRDDLFRVIENLVENAIRHGKSNGRVAVSLSHKLRAPHTLSGTRAENMLALEVADDGPGIAENHIPRLTERFYRVDSDKGQARVGTGLGLSIVKHIISRHQGRLDIESKLGEGSRFTVLLSQAQT
jgi:two-component system, OmpR family, phosphate regulon sensor histidine kinase PhoR